MTDNRHCKLNLLKRRAWCNVLRRRQNSNFISECHIFTSLIALSHIHVSAGYRSHIYEHFDTLRSEPNFVRATYAPCTYDVPATFTWRNSDVSLFVWKIHCRMYSVSMRNELRTCDVFMAYEVYARCIYGVCTTFHSYLRRICSVPIAF